MDVQVVAGDGEPLESLLRRFKREVNNSGHLMELKHRRYFENGQDIIKRKIKEVPERLASKPCASRARAVRARTS
jgi:ribosomal protein S21